MYISKIRNVVLGLLLVIVETGCFFQPREGEKNFPIDLISNEWANGKIVDSSEDKNEEQWFSFEAALSVQLIYIKFGTLDRIYVSLYDSNNDLVGSEQYVRGKSGEVQSCSWTTNKGESYLIKVSAGGNTGTFKLCFTSFPAQPDAQPDADSNLQKYNEWKTGSIIQPDNGGTGEQWFVFNTPAGFSGQTYIYFKCSTITDLTLQLYDKEFNKIGDDFNIKKGTDKKNYSLSQNEEYYIKVFSKKSGQYWIGVTDFPAEPERKPTDNIESDKWINGSISIPSKNSSGEEWFVFEAPGKQTVHIYIKRGTITERLEVSLFDKDLNTIGNSFYSDELIKNQAYELIPDERYYINVSSEGEGTYSLGYNVLPAVPGTDIKKNELTEDCWKNGKIINPKQGGTGEQWFYFEATSASQYIYFKGWTDKILHARVYLYNEDCELVKMTELSHKYLFGDNHDIFNSLIIGSDYFIKVTDVNDGYDYSIAFTSVEEIPSE